MLQKKSKRLQLDVRRLQLIELGLKYFSNLSYDEVNLDEVAKKGKISKGLLFHYFPTKRDFYKSVIEIAAQRLLDLTAFDPTAPAISKLEDCLDAYIEFVQQHAKAYITLLRSGIGSDPSIAKILDRTRGVFVSRVLEGMGSFHSSSSNEELLLVIRGWVGFVEVTGLDWLEKGHLKPKELRNLWIKILGASLAVCGIEPKQ